jgi:hypothetical protein
MEVTDKRRKCDKMGETNEHIIAGISSLSESTYLRISSLSESTYLRISSLSESTYLRISSLSESTYLRIDNQIAKIIHQQTAINYKLPDRITPLS